jgi:hypothetical protein
VDLVESADEFIYALAVLGREFSEIHTEADSELMVADNARGQNLMAVRQSKLKVDFRSCYRRNEAFDESATGAEVEYAAFPPVSVHFAADAQQIIDIRSAWRNGAGSCGAHIFSLLDDESLPF